MEFCCKNLFLFFSETSTNVLLIEQQIARPDILAAGPNLHVRPVHVCLVAAAGSLQTGAGEGDTAGAAAASGPRVCPVDPSYLLPCVCC